MFRLTTELPLFHDLLHLNRFFVDDTRRSDIGNANRNRKLDRIRKVMEWESVC